MKSNDKEYECKLKGVLKKQNDKFNCLIGDYVEFDENENIIIKIEDRKNFIERPLISNVDYLAISFSVLSPELDYINMQKMILNAYYRKINPIILITKIDLMDDTSMMSIKSYLDNLLNNLNIPIFYISSYNNKGITDFLKFIENTTTAISGPSGTGKSSIINVILGNDFLEIGDISHKTNKGKHTTKESRVFELKNNIILIDTPGFSSLNYPTLTEKKDLEKLFPDFEKYSNECRYTDCIHINEPKCKIKSLVENDNIIHKDRYDFYTYSYDQIFNKRW